MGQRLDVIGSPSCAQTTGSELKPACVASCQSACAAGVAKYAADAQSFSGYGVTSEARERVQRGCQRQCTYDCGKPGRSFDFSIPYRP